jgi:hypothetical protein
MAIVLPRIAAEVSSFGRTEAAPRVDEGAAGMSGRGLQQLGETGVAIASDQLQAIGQQVRAAQKIRDQQYETDALSGFMENQTKAYIAAQRSAPAGAAGFADGFMQLY